MFNSVRAYWDDIYKLCVGHAELLRYVPSANAAQNNRRGAECQDFLLKHGIINRRYVYAHTWFDKFVAIDGLKSELTQLLANKSFTNSAVSVDKYAS